MNDEIVKAITELISQGGKAAILWIVLYQIVKVMSYACWVFITVYVMKTIKRIIEICAEHDCL